jgi:hypothetical protein
MARPSAACVDSLRPLVHTRIAITDRRAVDEIEHPETFRTVHENCTFE